MEHTQRTQVFISSVQVGRTQLHLFGTKIRAGCLGSLASGGSTKEITFSEVPAQIASSAAGATINISISAQLGLKDNQFGTPGTVRHPGHCVMTGGTDEENYH